MIHFLFSQIVLAGNFKNQIIAGQLLDLQHEIIVSIWQQAEQTSIYFLNIIIWRDDIVNCYVARKIFVVKFLIKVQRWVKVDFFVFALIMQIFRPFST